MEIGGYIEFEKFYGDMLYDNAIKVNCGRSALAYLIEARHIKKIVVPKFMCDCNDHIFQQYHIAVRKYCVDINFRPKDIALADDEWLYIVNYYGQLSNEYLSELVKKYKHVIVDNAQAYFQEPLKNVDTFYTCRKFFGVADGAILFTNCNLEQDIPIDNSFDRMHFLFGRFERTASEFYAEYVANNNFFDNEPIKCMSKLTENILHGIDYRYICKKRTDNFKQLHDKLGNINKLQLTVPEGAFMYPLYVANGAEIRKKLLEKKIYISVLWPNVLQECVTEELEYNLAQNILPLPCDQRYGKVEMKYLIEEVLKCIG